MTETTATVARKLAKKPTIKPILTKSFRIFDAIIFDTDKFNKLQEEDQDTDEDATTEYKKKVDNRQLIIQLFGINEQGETYCIYVDDFLPFFYIKVDDWWTPTVMREFERELKQKVPKEFHDSLLNIELVDKHKLYGFTGGKTFKFLYLTFKNAVAMAKYKNCWFYYDQETQERKRVNLKHKNTVLELYESNIPPLLRYFHIHNISPSGWVSFKPNRSRKPIVKTTTCTYEYICSITGLTPMPTKETSVPYKICSYDIEASSSHGDFPIPIKDYKRLANNIVDIFIQQLEFLDANKAKVLLTKTIMTAFGFSKFEDVDLVYPKEPVSKEVIARLIEILLNKSVETILEENANSETSKLLMVTDYFEKSHTKLNYKGANEVDGEEGANEVEEGTNEDTSEVEEDEVEEDEVEDTKQKLSKTEKKLIQKKTIIDILLSTTHTKDDKVHYLNKIIVLLNFPLLEGDKVTFIGSTFKRYGDAEPYLNHCIVLGTCDPIDNITVETVETEQDLLLKWTELIQKENPDIIIGYNIFGFDYEFMFRRCQENHCVDEFLALSRIQGEICLAKPAFGASASASPSAVSIDSTKIQIAAGEFDLRYVKMAGRLQIDMYTYFRRDFNLSSYKLDDVAGEYIGDKIVETVLAHDPHLGGDVTELYSENLMGLHVNDYIHIEIVTFTTDHYKSQHSHNTKFKVVDIRQGQDTACIVIQGHEDLAHMVGKKNKILKWGIAKDDVTPQDIFRLANGTSADRAIVAKYCVQDCNLVHHLMGKIDVLTGYNEMSRICSVPISFLVFRGQGIKLTSYVAKKCREQNTLMPDLDKCTTNEGYEGAIVLPPKCAMYMDNPVACVDYASLYPSAMISQNYSHDSKVWMKEYDLEGKLIRVVGERDKRGVFIYDNLPGYQYIDIEFDNYRYFKPKGNPFARAIKTKVGKVVCRWAQLPDNKKSIMPAILAELLQARSATKKLMKKEKDPFMKNILDKRQNGYKVTANSLYGQCGSKTSTFYDKDIAAATTATGRLSITYAKRIIEEVYGDLVYTTKSGRTVRSRAEYVYGDTDSVFFTFNLETVEGVPIRGKDALEITIEMAQDVAQLCSKWLKAPMELAYEKTMMPFILLSKKRYLGMLYEIDILICKLKLMGISIKRRDNCDYLKDVFGTIINILMDDEGDNIRRAIDYLNHALTELAEGRVALDKLTITKALRSNYKKPLSIGHKVLADRIGKRDPGNKPKCGERIKFVFIVNNNKKALMGDKIETPEFIVENGLKVDYAHYITNQLMKPLQQFFGLALEQIWEMQNKREPIKTWKRDIQRLEDECEGDLELFMKKREKLCSAKVKTLLFDKILNKIANDKNRMQPITNFFTSAKCRM